VTDEKTERMRQALLRWYDRTKRDLPWRRARDPYAIWIAETMLQQTQVKTVLPYYRRFLKAFPSVAALARARRERVLALWSGLGYYRRAVNLKRAARTIVNVHDGKLPRDFAALRALPGVGPYTAGALMSIAFGAPYPALDGNARRVLTRWLGIRDEKTLQRAALGLVAGPRPGDFNQALMDLGATICRARAPDCASCPVRRACRARRSGGDYRAFPRRKAAARKIDWPLAAIARGGTILLRRRPRAGLLGGLWEIPGGERRKNESLRSTLRRELDGLAAPVRLQSVAGVVRHSITDRRIRAPVYRCSVARPDAFPDARPPAGWRWFRFRSLDRYPLSSLSLKAARLVAEP
jgi:A/G-specific adenine glycosylase